MDRAAHLPVPFTRITPFRANAQRCRRSAGRPNPDLFSQMPAYWTATEGWPRSHWLTTWRGPECSRTPDPHRLQAPPLQGLMKKAPKAPPPSPSVALTPSLGRPFFGAENPSGSHTGFNLFPVNGSLQLGCIEGQARGKAKGETLLFLSF